MATWLSWMCEGSAERVQVFGAVSAQNERHIGSNSLLYITKPPNREKLDGVYRKWI